MSSKGEDMIKTRRLEIAEFKIDMAESVMLLSLDEDNKRFLPDEVFETREIAEAVILDLIEAYQSENGPFVYPILLNKKHIGHVELIQIDEGYEVGYHIGKEFCGHGYATEALIGFLNHISESKKMDKVYGICDSKNVASQKVLIKAGFVLEYEGMGKYHGSVTPICRYKKVFKSDF